MPFDFKIILPENAVSVFEEALSESAGAILTRLLEKGPHAGSWELQAIFEERPDHGALKDCLAQSATRAHIKSPRLCIRKMPDINWLEASYQGFPPIEVGPTIFTGPILLLPHRPIKLPLKLMRQQPLGRANTKQHMGA